MKVIPEFLGNELNQSRGNVNSRRNELRVATYALFCRIKRVRHSDIARYSDIKEDAIEIPRIFLESRNPRDKG